MTKKVEVTNQKATQSVDGTVGINNFPTDQKVSDSDLLAKLTELDSKMNGIIDGSTPASSQLVGSYVAKSTEIKPAGENGNSLFLWDTSQVFLHDGTEWREI